MTPSTTTNDTTIEPATFRLVAQSLNKLRHRVPHSDYNETSNRVQKLKFKKLSHKRNECSLCGSQNQTQARNSVTYNKFAVADISLSSPGRDCSYNNGRHHFLLIRISVVNLAPGNDKVRHPCFGATVTGTGAPWLSG
jgi:hypothetical protein